MTTTIDIQLITGRRTDISFEPMLSFGIFEEKKIILELNVDEPRVKESEKKTDEVIDPPLEKVSQNDS